MLDLKYVVENKQTLLEALARRGTSLEEIRRYYLYHLFLHELGHFHQPDVHSRRRAEEWAENFALEWARRLGELEPSYEAAELRLLRRLEEKYGDPEG